MYQQQPQYPPQPYPPQPYPRRAVTRRPLSPAETAFHVFMTAGTAGLWGIVWWSRVRSRRQVTTWQ
jgi:hypothetical protein